MKSGKRSSQHPSYEVIDSYFIGIEFSKKIVNYVISLSICRPAPPRPAYQFNLNDSLIYVPVSRRCQRCSSGWENDQKTWPEVARQMTSSHVRERLPIRKSRSRPIDFRRIFLRQSCCADILSASDVSEVQEGNTADNLRCNRSTTVC